MADNRIDVQRKIEAALAQIWGVDFAGEAETLLGALGYRSERTLPGQSGTVDDFLRTFSADNPGTKSEGEFRKQAASVNILFQVTDSEINEAARSQLSMFANEEFDKGSVRSFMFAAVELTGERYARGQYAAFTREVNKRFSSPAVVLFRTADGLLTLSFVHVRPNKRKPERDVLGSVSLIREVKTDDPHRAHVDILAELALEDRLRWMDTHGKSRDFDGLLAAWLDALDTEELNRRFYRVLKDWFDRAVEEARFPEAGPRVLQPEEHVIRLITRLLFVWFVKEKGLVADELFIEAQVRGLLKDYDAANGDSYYRAVLQNLFFATLNTEISRRGFSSQANATHRDFSVYRYRAEMSDPDALFALFAQTPFINGGLFDCLDSEEATGPNAYRIDYFTDNIIDPRRKGHEYRALSIPNHLFFDNAGLITLFNHYKFTVEENTPAEQEVALDPELLGKVFENLLAAYNPETRESARKQTGSFYTPRAVVDYMVDEALVASLAQKARPDGGDASWWEELLHYLLDYNDAGELFDEAETDRVVRAIAGLRVLDPAVGSGAFPMGVLHKLTLALRRLDPDNTRWEALQKELAGERAKAAFDEPNQRERDAELDEISDTFERYRDSDFGRKLYLIQNSIYGVDIQTVACQIAKLRFFISLAIEQQPTDDRSRNYGIHPLPNLETRFVAANTLLGLERPLQMTLAQTEVVQELEQRLTANRERHFHAVDRRTKMRIRDEDKRLRRLLSEELQRAGFPAAAAESIAYWEPFDQNASAGWFDPEYMFGVADGFDVVIGNPPYVSHDKISHELKLALRNHYKAWQPFADMYCYFVERAVHLQSNRGILALITSNSYLRAEYGAPLRKFLKANNQPIRIVNIEDSQVFESVIVNVAIVLSRRMTHPEIECVIATGQLLNEDLGDFVRNNGFICDQSYFSRPSWTLLPATMSKIQDKIAAAGPTLAQLGTKIRLGLATGGNAAFLVTDEQKQAFSQRSSANLKIIKPILRGRDIARYAYDVPGLHILLTKNGVDVMRDYPDIYEHLESFGQPFKTRGAQGDHWTNLRACSFFEDFKEKKIIWIELADTGRFALCDEEIYLLNSAYFLLPPSGIDAKLLLGILNSSTIRFYLSQIAGTSGMGTSRWINNYVREFPIPSISGDQQSLVIALVNEVMAAKDADSSADTGELEAEIDGLVYALYGLTADEIVVVEGR